MAFNRHVTMQTRGNEKRVDELKLEYCIRSRVNDIQLLDVKMKLPWEWYGRLEWLDQKIAMDTARLFQTGARVTFWEQELRLREREARQFPIEVILERMELRRRQNLNQCYGKIYRCLGIPANIPRPTLPIVTREVEEAVVMFDAVNTPIQEVMRAF